MSVLWDRVIEPYGDALNDLDQNALGEVSLRAVELTVPLFVPPFDEYFSPTAGDLVRSTLAICRSTPLAQHVGTTIASDFHVQRDALPVTPIRPGFGPFLMAVERLVDGLAAGMDADATLEIMSACYEAVLVSQLTGRVTFDREHNNEMCSRQLCQQEKLILSHIR